MRQLFSDKFDGLLHLVLVKHLYQRHGVGRLELRHRVFELNGSLHEVVVEGADVAVDD